MERDYLIAGLRVRMDSWGRTERQAQPYLAHMAAEPDIYVNGTAEALQEGQPHLSLDDCEYLSTGGSFYRQLLKFDGMLLHASAVVYEGYAYLFSAPCGTGKSTHTKLWIEAFGAEKVQMLNDDKPALRLENGCWYAYGTPWSGKTDQNTNMKVPVGGICVLTRGTENRIEPFGGSRAVFALLEQTARPMGSEPRGRMLELMDQLLARIPVWRMACTPTADAARMACGAMSALAGKK